MKTPNFWILGLLALIIFTFSCNNNSSDSHPNKIQNTYDMRTGLIPSRLSIAMWDYTWLLRHHKEGDFENWDMVLDGLVERGYNAIRMDCFPQLVAANSKGIIQEEYFHVRESWKPSINRMGIY